MTKLLVRLDKALQSASSSIERAEILARKGSYFARIGNFDGTREIIFQLRQQFGDGRSGHVTAWIMLTEGLLYLFENLSPMALDRITRSQILGLAMKDSSVIAISSAWKAHIEFETSKFEEMIRSIQVSMMHAKEDDHDANARLAMVLSDSFLLCGDLKSAQFWFLKSRDHALKDGDIASIEALLYNRAAFGLARLRAEACISKVDQDKLSLVRLEIASAKNLQNLSQINALTNFIDLCEARLLILEEKYGVAINALQRIRDAKPFADYNFNQSFVDLELSFCFQRLGRIEESRRLHGLITWSDFDKLDIDEQLVAAWMRHALYKTDKSYGPEDDAKARLDSLCKEYQQMRDDLMRKLIPFSQSN